MRPATLARLAVAGTRTDLFRVVLTAVSAALATMAMLAAANVLAIRGAVGDDQTPAGWAEQYSTGLLREPGLRPGVAFALLLLTIPVLTLAGQCSRLGAPARERRLAALRLAGATPGQTVAVAVAETGVAGVLGSALGLVAYLVGHRLAHRPDAQGSGTMWVGENALTSGTLALPTDVLPPPWAIALICLGVPALAAGAAALTLRRVTFGPFGVVRRVSRADVPPRWPAALIVVGFALFAASQPLSHWLIGPDQGLPRSVSTSVLILGALVATLGVVLGTGWLSYTAGRVLHRYGRGPATLIAARRLLADPWHAGRTFAALLACVVFAGGAVAQRAYFEAMNELLIADERRSIAEAGVDREPIGDTFYLNAMDLVELAVAIAVVIAVAGMAVSLAESIVARRRTYAALVATGVPRRALAKALIWQVMAPAVPAVALGLAVGAALQWSTTGGEVQNYGGVRAVPVPLPELAAAGVLALLAVLATAGVGLLFLRDSTSIEELRAG